jgi:YHS domain-containing protein
MQDKDPQKEKDPVCQMEVDRRTAATETEYEGKTYYFCCRQCREQFEANPQKYVQQKQTRT